MPAGVRRNARARDGMSRPISSQVEQPRARLSHLVGADPRGEEVPSKNVALSFDHGRFAWSAFPLGLPQPVQASYPTKAE